MLSKSFKPAKCKTSLKLATSRIKLMKNKKGIQMNQMKRELAQLLESGQDRTARIRVEHLIREEKMVAAYELIEIYCELIAARLSVIESQKNCPVDLKEAIASVIFASPRCADIPELTDIKKHFTAKYGKEFITAALELRPNSGVGRMVVEKLSAVAPDVQTKAKVLNAIAEEHNINWNSLLFVEKESKPAEDLLNGPSTFEKAGEMHAVSKIQDPNVQAPSSYDQHVRPSNMTESNSGSILNSQKYSAADHGGTTTGTNSYLRSSGSWAERMENRQSFGRSDSYSDAENWDMEFKDATSAAHAAAESAERASMAARAAVELSSRESITRRYSTETQNLNEQDARHERRGNYSSSRLPSDQFNNTPRSDYFHDKTSFQNEAVGIDSRHNLSGNDEYSNTDVQEEDRRHSRSTSQGYSKASISDDRYYSSMQKPNEYTEDTSSTDTSRTKEDLLFSKNVKTSVEVGNKSASWRQDEIENVNQFGGASMGRQHNSSSSLSRSSTDDENYQALNYRNRKSTAPEDPFVENDQDIVHNDNTKMGSYNDYFAAFDEYESNDDNSKINARPNYDEESSYLPSPGRTSTPLYSSEQLASQSHSFAQNPFSPRFSESLAKSVNPPESDDMPAPKFDSEDELDNSIYVETNDSRISSSKPKLISQNPKSATVETYGSTGSLSFEEIYATGSADTSKDDLLASQDGGESANNMSFGTSDGYRSQNYSHPPYNRKLPGDASSSMLKGAAKQYSSNSSYHSRIIDNEEKNSRFSTLTTHSDLDADADYPVDKISQKADRTRPAPRAQTASMKSTFMPPVGSYLDHDNKDSTEDGPEESLSSRNHLLSGNSQRTKTSNERKTYSSNYGTVPVASVSPQSHNERKNNGNGYGAVPSTNLMFQSKMAPSLTGSGKQPSTTTQATSKATPVSQTSTLEKNSKPSIPYRATEAKGNLENVKAPTVKAEAPKGEDSAKRPSHVHPKLPDYQTLAAHMQTLRSNRR